MTNKIAKLVNESSIKINCDKSELFKSLNKSDSNKQARTRKQKAFGTVSYRTNVEINPNRTNFLKS